MNSGNHVMLLSDVLIWLHEDLGIKNREVAYKKLLMEPVPEGLTRVNATYRSSTAISTASGKGERFV